MRNFKGGIFGRFDSSSRRLQSSQTKWKLSFSASDRGIPRHRLCCQTLHFSQAPLCEPSSSLAIRNYISSQSWEFNAHQVFAMGATATATEDPLALLSQLLQGSFWPVEFSH